MSKKTAEEQRTLWLEVGVALMYGKAKENRKAGQKFSEWVQAMFPGLHAQDGSDAMWFAENSNTVLDSCTLTHPRRIREEHRDHQATQALPEDLQSVAPIATPSLTQRDAEKVVKVIQRAASASLDATR